MKLAQLHIENFGVYHGRTFEFGEGLQVIYGPNEAGKSTLLNVLRHAFFGFPHRNPYGAARSDKPVAVSARMRLADGRAIRFRRQKGQPDHVTGEIERERTELDAARLGALLGGAHDELFRHIFAFSLEELAAGEKSLSDAGMSEALFGGGIGGLDNFLKVRSEVEESHKALFNSRGRKGEINQLLTQLGEVSNQYKAATLKPRDLDQLRDTLEEVQGAIDRIRTGQDFSRAKLHRLDRLKDALPHWRRAAALRQDLAQQSLPATLQRTDAEALRRLQQRLEHLDQEIFGHASELDRARAVASTEVPVEGVAAGVPAATRNILAEAAAIRQLAEDLGRCRSAHEDLLRIEREGLASPAPIEARLRDLHPSWTLENLTQLSTSLAQVASAEALLEESRGLRGREDLFAAKRPDFEQQLERVRRRLESLPAHDRTAALQALVHRGQEYRPRAQRLADITSRAADLDRRRRQIARQLQVLASPVGTEDGAAAEPAKYEQITPPLVATVAEFQQRLTELARERDAARQRLRDLGTEQERVSEQLHALDHLQAIPDSSALRRQRQHRDAGWSVLRSQLEDESAAPAAEWQDVAPEDLVRRYEEAVEQADAGADRRFEAAELVARREQLAATRSRLETSRQDANDSLASAERQLQEAEQEWASLWKGFPFRPQPPAAMLEWLGLWKQAADLGTDAIGLEQEREELQAQNAQLERELFRAFPDAAPSAEAALAQAQEAWQTEKQSQAERATLEEERLEIEAKLEALERDQYDLTMKLADHDSRRRRLAGELRLPAACDPAALVTVFRGARELQEKHRQILAAAEQRERLETVANDFQTAVERLTKAVAPDLAAFPPQEAAEGLIHRLDAARREELESARRVATLSTAEQLLATCRASREEVCDQIAAALQAHGLPPGTAVAPLVDALEAAARQREQLAEAEQQCRVMGGDDPAFAEGLASLDEDRLAAERKRIEEQLEQEDKAYREQLSQLGSLRAQWSALEGDVEAPNRSRQLEDLRSRLGSAVDRWAPLVLTQTLMTEALRRFEQEHQPQILIDTARLLGQFTAGEYVDLQRKLDDRGTLLVVPARGEPKRPGQLSTGTREQLYLAIRLAYLKDYGRRAEPLPIVMDDVLVNFDEDRGRRTLEALVEFGRENQILFLTCHRRIVETLQRLEPQLRPLELHPGSLAKIEAEDETHAAEDRGGVRGPKRRPRRPSEPDHPALFPS